MKLKVLSLLAFMLTGGLTMFAQQLDNVHHHEGKVRCYTEEHFETLRTQNPDLETRSEFEKWLAPKVADYKQNLSSKGTNAVTTIPVIFHIVHNNGADNISATYVNAQIDQLNNDFRRIAGTSGFGNGVDTELEFCAAIVDPSGNTLSEPGIDRVSRSSKGFTTPPYNTNYVDNTIKPNTVWNPDDYCNIWVCALSGGILGYAQFPSSSGLGGLSSNGGSANTDGVVVTYTSVGSTSTPFPGGGTYNKGRTLTHEIGHWVGLRHIWGDGGCSVDDFCADTPASDGPNYGCPNTVSCGSTDQVQNYMDYTDDDCMNMYTADQKARIQTVMANSPRRGSLANSTACSGGGGGGGGGECTDTEVTITIVADDYGSETTWSLTNASGGTVASGGPYSNNSTNTVDVCLPDGCYDFTINDSYGDGICCSYGNGSYTVDAGSTNYASGGSFGTSETTNFCVGGGGGGGGGECSAIDFNSYSIDSYGGSQDNGTGSNYNNGEGVLLSGNAWKSIALNYTVTPNTVIEFDFGSTAQGEIHGIGFDSDNGISSNRTFQLYGTQNWGITGYNYTSPGSWQSFVIPVGTQYTGTFDRLFFTNDKDGGSANNNSYFRNIKIYEGSCNRTGTASAQAVKTELGTEGEYALDVYPAPMGNTMNTRLDAPDGEYQGTLYDLSGRVIWQGMIPTYETSHDVSGLPSGVFFLKVAIGDQEVLTQKVMKTR